MDHACPIGGTFSGSIGAEAVGEKGQMMTPYKMSQIYLSRAMLFCTRYFDLGTTIDVYFLTVKKNHPVQYVENTPPNIDTTR